MDHHVAGRNIRTNNPYSRIDWPLPETLLAARRARGKAMRDMARSVAEGANALIERSLRALRSRREMQLQPVKVSSKR